MRQWIIYKHTSIHSGKSYVGLTKNSIEYRWSQHKSNAKAGSSAHFHNAIRLYGTANWKHEILAENIPTLKEANNLEKYFIRKEDTFENGYNLTIGGDGNGGRVWSQEEKDLADSVRPTYKFVHFKYGIEELTLIKMAAKYSLSKGNLHGLITMERESCGGWQMFSVVGNSPVNFSPDTSTYTFTNSGKIISNITIKEFAKLIKVRPAKVKYMMAGLQKTIKGWICPA